MFGPPPVFSSEEAGDFGRGVGWFFAARLDRNP